MSYDSIIDKRVTLIKAKFPESLFEYLRKYVSIKNPAKLMAEKEHLYGWWKMDDYINLWSEDDTYFYIPRGFAFDELHLEDALDKRVKSYVDFSSLQKVNLRDYQKIACNLILERQQGVWIAPPGAGKTTTLLEAIRRSNQKTLIIVDKTNIAEQWRERAREFLNVDIGLIGDGIYSPESITVVLQQTLWSRREVLKKKGFFDEWGFVVVDECFVAGTLVDNTPIENLKIGQKISTGKIKRIIKRKPDSLVLVKIKNKKIVCTPNHLFMTESGEWVEARNLNGKMLVVQSKNRIENKTSKKSMGKKEKSLLFKRMFKQKQWEISIRKTKIEKSNGKQKNERKNVKNFEKNWTQTAYPGWQWEAGPGSAAIFGYTIKMANRSSSENRKWISSSSLQNRYSKRGIEDSDRNRWPFSWNFREKKARSEKNRPFGIERVESVKILEPGIDRKFGGLCPDGYVYDLEIENSHIYFANEVLVHNCHHVTSETFQEIISEFSSFYRVGISATPYKARGYEDIVDIILGSTIHKTEKSVLRTQGWLIKPSVKIWNTGFNHDYFSTHKTDGVECFIDGCTRDVKKRRHQNNYADITNTLISDWDRNLLIATNVKNELMEGHCIIVLSRRLKHLDDIAKIVAGLMGTHKFNYQFTGKQTTSERMEIVKRADDGKCVLYSTIADEALDIPRLDRVHLAWPTRNTDLILQQVGRIERPHKDKKDAIINDYLDDVGPLRSQLKERAYNVYIKDKLTIEVEDESLLI